MAKRTKKSAATTANTEGAPSAESVASIAPSTSVGSDAPEAQTADAGKAADAGVTVPAPAADMEPGPASGEGETAAPPVAAPVGQDDGAIVEAVVPLERGLDGSLGMTSAEQPAAPSPTIVMGDSPNVQAVATGQDEPKPDADDFHGIVRITSRIEGFRRAGMRHSKTPVDHPLETFSDEQLLQLEEEPNLTVEYL